MFATDRGGWMLDLESSAQSTPMAPALAANRVMPASARPRTPFGFARDTMITAAAMTYQYQYLYTDSLPGGIVQDSLPTWNPNVYQIDGKGIGTGTITVDTTFSAVFRHVAEEIVIRGVKVGEVKLRFRGLGDDSLFATFRPVLRGGNHVFYNTIGFCEYDNVDYDRTLANPFPLEGLVTAYLFADRLRSANPNDIEEVFEAELKVTFDATQSPIATISDIPDDPSPPFRYRVNLRTGTFVRL
jgi:hypothetical protein